MPDTVSASRAIPHILLRGMAWQESLWQHFDPNTGCTKTSADGGYGLMQITTCMKTGDNCSGISQSRVSGEWKYNLGTGTKLLIQKWNTVAPFVGDNDHTVAEQWYFAILAYNGWSSANDPNSSAFNPSRPPFGEGNYPAFGYPYQERVSGWMAHPEIAASRWLWQPTRIAAIPRGIFGLRGTNDWRPPTTTPQPKFTLFNPIRVTNGVGPSIVLQNTTNQTLAVDIALYNSNHTFNTWWLDTTSSGPYFRIPYIRLAANASRTLRVADAFLSGANFDGYARINASDGIVTSLQLSPYKTLLPIINNGSGANLVLNSGFEEFVDGKPRYWSVSSRDGFLQAEDGYALADGTWFRSGHYAAHLGGYDYAQDALGQSITIPSGNGCLAFAWYVTTQETGTLEYDKLSVVLSDVYGNRYELYRLNNLSLQNTWQTTRLDVTGFSGQAWVLSLEADVDFSYPTSFFLDDLNLSACGF